MMMILQQHNSQQPHRRRTIFVPKKAVRAHTTIKQRLSKAELGSTEIIIKTKEKLPLGRTRARPVGCCCCCCVQFVVKFFMFLSPEMGIEPGADPLFDSALDACLALKTHSFFDKWRSILAPFSFVCVLSSS